MRGAGVMRDCRRLGASRKRARRGRVAAAGPAAAITNRLSQSHAPRQGMPCGARSTRCRRDNLIFLWPPGPPPGNRKLAIPAKQPVQKPIAFFGSGETALCHSGATPIPRHPGKAPLVIPASLPVIGLPPCHRPPPCHSGESRNPSCKLGIPYEIPACQSVQKPRGYPANKAYSAIPMPPPRHSRAGGNPA